MTTQKRILVIAGPTGCGETTVAINIHDRFPKVARVVTATTRPQREGERTGEQYLFFSEEDFMACVREGTILEHTYIPNRKVYYGTYAPSLERQLKESPTLIINTDLAGTNYFKKHYSAATVFLAPRSLEELQGRLKLKNPELSTSELTMRFENALNELDEKDKYDYIVINEEGKLEHAVEEVISILRKEGYEIE